MAWHGKLNKNCLLSTWNQLSHWISVNDSRTFHQGNNQKESIECNWKWYFVTITSALFSLVLLIFALFKRFSIKAPMKTLKGKNLRILMVLYEKTQCFNLLTDRAKEKAKQYKFWHFCECCDFCKECYDFCFFQDFSVVDVQFYYIIVHSWLKSRNS